MSFDLGVAWFLVALTITGIVFYLSRVVRLGRAQFDRIDRAGGSILLNKEVMVMGYWWFEPLGKWLHNNGISANAVSWSAFACGVFAAISVSQGFFGLAGLFVLLSGLLDVVDGMVARFSNSSNPAGEVLDSSLDRYVDFFFLAGLVFYYQQTSLLVGLVLFAMLGSFMISYSTAKAEAMHITPPRGAMKRSERIVYIIGASILSPFSINYLESGWDYVQPLALPMLFSISLIAVIANI
ncbi:MAG: CDP-alcohol phosphatidyltransferase family protein, partial [Gammaproteobacteria bacterium]|nr:CDP-alcohol phosphatidyltransferase family protein [Gammaproteobacteria bacterium]